MDFDELDVYKLAIELSEWIYDITKSFHEDEKYVIKSRSKTLHYFQ